MKERLDIVLVDRGFAPSREKAKTMIMEGNVFVKGNLSDKALVDKIFSDYKPDIVVNLAAQAGVRYSIDYPEVYESYCKVVPRALGSINWLYTHDARICVSK